MHKPMEKRIRGICSIVLPTVYNDSLSYYECISKLIEYCKQLAETIKEIGAGYEVLEELVKELKKAIDEIDIEGIEELKQKVDSLEPRIERTEEKAATAIGLTEILRADIVELEREIGDIKLELDTKMEYYILKCEYTSDGLVITHDGQVQTYGMIDQAFEDSRLFVYMVFNHHIYIPSIDISTGIVFDNTSIYRESNGELYPEHDRVLITMENEVSIAHLTAEIADHRVTEMLPEEVELLTPEEKEMYYPSVGAVEQFVDKKLEGVGPTLPIASATVLGGVKIGAGLSISEDGTLSASGGGGYTYKNVTLETNKNMIDYALKYTTIVEVE